ncbi:protein of unknown function [Candidatus Nitrosotalea okcheonensis]|uniref:Uncharacterized protein n=1 Tax=Candidatus Nitrosotalea okcheonensis TaxID=1903276 RepID=A0A2H1FEV4_9ARCH|nr:protein of unknown function [Candidatus Nitrosotalea okcheonensis]
MKTIDLYEVHMMKAKVNKNYKNNFEFYGRKDVVMICFSDNFILY